MKIYVHEMEVEDDIGIHEATVSRLPKLEHFKPYASIETDHPDEAVARFFVDEDPNNGVYGIKTYEFCGDSAIDLVREFIWDNYHEQGFIELL